MNNKQYKEVMRNYKEMVDSNSINARFVFHVDREGFCVGGITLDLVDDRDVPNALNLEEFIKSVYYDATHASYDYYEISRDDSCEVALVTYLDDVLALMTE